MGMKSNVLANYMNLDRLKKLYQIIRKALKVLYNSIMHHEAYTVVFWRAEDNSHCMVDRQINLAHAHCKNSWSGYPI